MYEIPLGITVTIGQAARILGISPSVLKRNAAKWGLDVTWDGRGRRYSVYELKKLQESPLEPKVSDILTQDISTIESCRTPAGFRFRAYGTGENKGYLGFYPCSECYQVLNWLSRNFGAGTYCLKLLDEDNRMTPYNFLATVGDPNPKDETDKTELLVIKAKRDRRKTLNHEIRMLKKVKKFTGVSER